MWTPMWTFPNAAEVEPDTHKYLINSEISQKCKIIMGTCHILDFPLFPTDIADVGNTVTIWP